MDTANYLRRQGRRVVSKRVLALSAEQDVVSLRSLSFDKRERMRRAAMRRGVEHEVQARVARREASATSRLPG